MWDQQIQIEHYIKVFLIQIQVYNMHTLKIYVFGWIVGQSFETLTFSKNMHDLFYGIEGVFIKH
jgi:hypothetical protein